MEVIRVFVSGCYGLLHPGHIRLFEDARTLGHHLTVCVASDKTIIEYKGYAPPLSQDHRRALVAALRTVDEAVIGSDCGCWDDFCTALIQARATVLAVTNDDSHLQDKQRFCSRWGITLAVLPKTAPLDPISSTDVRAAIDRINASGISTEAIANE